MEKNLVRVPFETGLAKKITNGEVEGRIVTRDGRKARVACWNYKSLSGSYPLLVLVENGIFEEQKLYTSDGRYKSWEHEKKRKEDLFVEVDVRPYKDGDIATMGWEDESKGKYCIWITILKSLELFGDVISTEDYVSVCLSADNDNCFQIDFDGTSDAEHWVRKSTNEEIEKLISALKASKEPKAKEYLKRFFPKYSNTPNIEKDCKFKPFDKVLVRESNDFPWRIDLFSHIQDGAKPYVCLYHYWKYCIPYNEQTAHLLGTTDKLEEK